MEKPSIDHSQLAEETQKRIVDNTLSFYQLVITVANRLVSSYDIRNAMQLAIPGAVALGDLPQIGTDTASSLVRDSITQRLDDGRIVVINDLVNMEIVGVKKSEGGLEVLRIPRKRYRTVKQGDEERRVDLHPSQILIRNPSIATALHSDGQMELRVAEHDEIGDESNQGTVIHIPGAMGAGQQVVIASIAVEVKEEEYDEVDREYEEVEWIVESRKEITTGKREHNMREHVEYKEYKRRKEIYKRVLKDDGFTLRTSHPTSFEVLAVNGLHDGPGSYLRPSGWFIAGQEERQ